MRKYINFPFTIVTLLYIAFIFALSSIPGLSKPPHLLFQVLQNLAHIPVYFILTVLCFLSVKNTFQPKFYFIFFIPVFYGFIDEFHQWYVPGRYCDIMDVLLDTFGVLLGIISIKVFIKQREKIHL